MNKLKFTGLVSLLSLFTFISLSCSNPDFKKHDDHGIFAMDNLVAWCIVPFDAEDRNSAERAEMLDGLEFRKMAWDWRMEHIETLPDEISALQNHDIELTAVWLWLDRSSKDGLLPHHHKIFDAVAGKGVETTYWLSFSGDFFDGLTDDEKVEEAASGIIVVHDRIRKDGGSIALYNHMDWFGEPENQVRIIESIGRDSIGIVYNFHHAHHHIDDFPEKLDVMLPYLYTVNLNGMRRDGPKILDIGSGEEELRMMRYLKDSGFSGTIGVLGHTEGEDIEKVLTRNLGGLDRIVKEL